MIYGYASHLCNFKKNHHNGKTTGLAAYGSYEKTLEIFNKILDRFLYHCLIFFKVKYWFKMVPDGS